MNTEQSQTARQHILCCGWKKVSDYLSRFDSFFAEGLKEILPLPTTCCWSLVENFDEWTHIQYFVLTAVNLAYDISSNITSNQWNQLGATFYGSLFGHQTSQPVWVSKDGKTVTLSCPGNMYNFAWGRDGGSRPS